MGRIFLLGWVLLAAALYFVGIEMLYRRHFADAGFFVSAEELWRGLAGDGYADIRAWAAATGGTWVWRDVVEPLLAFPAWLLLGVPGAIVAWKFHPEAEPEHLAAAESAMTADRLAEAARRDGYDSDDDSLLLSDIAPVDDDNAAADAPSDSGAVYARLIQDARAEVAEPEDPRDPNDPDTPKRSGPWG